MKKSLLALIFLGFYSWADGGAVGNGGGFALCKNQKFYFYDYLITKDMGFRTDIGPVDLNQSIQFIYTHLKRLNDPLAKEFADFFSILYTQTPGKKFQWFQQKNLPLMYEPDLENRLPIDCRVRKQAVYFFPAFSGVPYASYKYDPDVLLFIQRQPGGNLQISYLWVHEWLWNYFSRKDFIKLAAFNRLLHSEALATIDQAAYLKLRPNVDLMTQRR